MKHAAVVGIKLLEQAAAFVVNTLLEESVDVVVSKYLVNPAAAVVITLPEQHVVVVVVSKNY